MFNPNVSFSWELTGPQIHPVMSDDRDTLLKMAGYLVNVSQQADMIKELFKLALQEQEEGMSSLSESYNFKGEQQ